MILIEILDIRNGRRYGLFLCLKCNKKVVRRLSHGLKQKSCGCSQYIGINHNNIKHGDCNTRLYRIWGRMIQRITNSNYPEFHYYGGRGIKVCQAWQDDYIAFRNWALNNGYQEGLTIDRIDNNGDYAPSNCRWVTYAENAQNKRNTKLNKEKILEIREKYIPYKYTLKMLAKEYNVRKNYIYRIIKKQAWGNI